MTSTDGSSDALAAITIAGVISLAILIALGLAHPSQRDTGAGGLRKPGRRSCGSGGQPLSPQRSSHRHRSHPMTPAAEMPPLQKVADEMLAMADAIHACSPDQKAAKLREWATRLQALAGEAEPVGKVYSVHRVDGGAVVTLDLAPGVTLQVDQPLYTHPAPTQPAVGDGITDAMAVRAIEARNAYLIDHPGEAVPAMRAALTAAGKGE
jgi:hypothetical protein